MSERMAGRELDAEIATKVMGLIVSRPLRTGWWLTNDPLGRGGLIPVRFYSTKIEHAVEVIEKVRCTDEAPAEVYWILTDCSSLGWRAEVLTVLTENDAPAKMGEAVALTLPLAICLAALEAHRDKCAAVSQSPDTTGEAQ